MSVASYRLDSPSPRPPPLPIRTQGLKSPSLSGINDAFPSQIESLSPRIHTPSTRTASRLQNRVPRSPPQSPRLRAGVRGLTPPPSIHNRSVTPSQPVQGDLEEFAEHCRAWYFEQNDDAGRIMTHTLTTLPPSQRAPFARLQASIRSTYHASVNARRNAEFKAHLSATQLGGSLMPHSRADPSGPLAKKERYERLERFLRSWCTMGMPGTEPFFQGLWAVMRLQVVPEHLGGAGGFRIEWEIDDAVFKEAAGKEFMLEAIDVLKGVLAFEEILSSKRSSSLTGSVPYSAVSSLSPIHSRSQSQPLPSAISDSARSRKAPPITSTTQTKRPRAPSDPFLDTPSLSTSYSSANTMAHPSTSGSTLGSTLGDDPVTPTMLPLDGVDLSASTFSVMESPDTEESMRIWIAPDLSNHEYLELLSAFPTFITRNTLPRFPVSESLQRMPDLEEGQEMQDELKRIRFGTGAIWVGARPRSSGWEGSWWIRFKLWVRRMFC